MKCFESASEMRAFTRTARAAGGRVAFVPTMGFLHEGHASLLRAGRERGEKLVLSIFVNPTQFDRKGDLDKYPRSLEADLEIAKRCGVDAVYLPQAGEMYPEGYETYVSVGPLAEPLCGAKRPGHFRGVTTVVTKLFTTVEPDLALFGEKDYQQLAIIRRMTTDLNLPVEIVGMPIIREKDGLAMSSRNARLSSDQRETSLALYRSIGVVREAFAGGERSTQALEALAKESLARAGDLVVDYAEVRNAASLRTIDDVTEKALYAVAAFVGDVRLIDNTELDPAMAA